MEFLFLLFIIFVIYYIKYESVEAKGELGENIVSHILSYLPNETYIVLNDILIKNGDKSIQIDHIVVSIYGIFVIETKNYKGWITGTESSYKWTQHIYNHKSEFFNPIKQNLSHINLLKKKLGLNHNKFISIIAFSEKADIKVKTYTDVCYMHGIDQCIQSYLDVKLKKYEVEKIVLLISSLNILEKEERQKHKYYAQSKATESNYRLQNNRCPLCNHELVIRDGKFGDFIGCSNYPICKFTDKL